MSIDMLGTWEGTISTGDNWVYPGLLDLQGNLVAQGDGGPTRTYNATLGIEWQGDFENFADAYSFTASPFSGFFFGDDPISGGYRVPVSGFLNPEGFLSCSFFGDKKPQPPNVQQVTIYWNFEAFIKNQGGFHILSGEFLMSNWQQHSIAYRFGTLNVKRKISLRERATLISKLKEKLFK